MLITLLFQSPLTFVIIGIGLIVALTIHEFAHAYIADKLGDPTARALDRVTLNPLAHLDPIGTLAILLVGFGWGKPVPFDPYNLQDPKRDTLFIALAGPASNFILATALAAVIALTSPAAILAVPLQIIIQINVMLGVFNLIPIPPLDGSKILAGILPAEHSIEYEKFANRYSTILLLMFILPIIGGQSLASTIISPIINLIMNLLL